MPKHQICIDGFAACGKSTLARGLADKLQFLYIDSGAMYRGVTWFFLQHSIPYRFPPSDELVQSIDLTFLHVSSGVNRLLLNGEDITEKLRSVQINQNVSKVAAMSNVRRRLVALQQEFGKNHNVVMDGRDIGTVVFPDAVLKLFVTADLETRVHRRLTDAASGNDKMDYTAVKKNLIQRDHIDSTRDDSPLIQASDAVLLDNTNLTIEEQLEMIFTLSKIRIGD